MENNNTNFNKVSTSGITLFDENGTMFRMGYLDDSLSLLIGEPRLADNGKRSYPQEARHPFIITLDRAAALYEKIIVEKVLPAIENGTNYNGGIFLNRRKDSIFEVRVQDGEIYLVLYKEIGEDRVPKENYVFKCQKTSLVEDYNPDGSSFEQSSVDGVFMIFCKYLDAGIHDLHNSSAHAFRKGNYHTTTAIFNYLKGISAKLGVTVNSGNTYQAPSQNSGFDEDLPFNENTSTAGSLSDLIA